MSTGQNEEEWTLSKSPGLDGSGLALDGIRFQI
jgi:hypothetical protein